MDRSGPEEETHYAGPRRVLVHPLQTPATGWRFDHQPADPLQAVEAYANGPLWARDVRAIEGRKLKGIVIKYQ
jgi:hypothetical protein